MPLKSYMDISSFKIYMIDVGLMGALCELPPEVIMYGADMYVEQKGAMTEQYTFVGGKMYRQADACQRLTVAAGTAIY